MSDQRIREGVEVLLAVGVVLFLIPAARGSDISAQLNGSEAFRHSSSTIYLQDDSSARWPVLRTARAWSAASDVNLQIGKCRSSAPCIRVADSTFSTGARNKPQYAVQRHGTYSGRSTAYVTLNNAMSLTSAQRRAVVCRELGRSLGLPTRTGSGSCMSGGAPRTQRPSQADVREVNRRY